MKILGFSGSLSAKSLNSAVLRAAGELLPAGAELEIVSLDLPLFNRDLEQDLPEAVRQFKAKILAADVLLIASPEYNYSISGVLKNALDWASRPYGTNAFSGKTGAFFGVSNGAKATARAYYEVHKILSGLNVFMMNYPQLLIADGPKKVDAEGKLADEETRQKLKTFLEALVDWAAKLKQAGIAK